MNDQPFSAVVCQSGPRARNGALLLQRLRPVTRRCPHGVLIRTGCLLRRPRCYTDPDHDSGAYLMVQPCGVDRQPQGDAIGIGPVLTRVDAAAVAQWLAYGDLDVALLEPRLRITAAPGIQADSEQGE